MKQKPKQETLNLNKLESQLDNALAKETKESLTNWLDGKRNKQETLEEAAKYYAHNYFEMHDTNNYKALKQGFEAGAKWQQEQEKNKYSKESIKHLDFIYGRLVNVHNENPNYDYILKFKSIIKQFKNK